MNINVADRVQIINKKNVHILKVQNENNETLWEYKEPTITGNDVLYAVDNTNQFDWDKQPEIYHLTNDSTNKIFFYKYSNFDHTESPVIGYARSFYGDEAWSDGTNTYINNYRYNPSTNTWSYRKWMVSHPPYAGEDDLVLRGEYVWTDGTDIYYLAETGVTHVQGGPAWKFNKSTDTWTQDSAIIPPDSANRGDRIWTDGTNVYYSNGKDHQYVWNKTNHTWLDKQWFYTDQLGYQFTFDFKGDELFEINGHIYGEWLRNGTRIIFFLNSEGKWEPTQMSTTSYISTLLFDNKEKFTDGVNTYASSSRYNDRLYKIIETEPGNLTYQKIGVKSCPKQANGLFASRAFSLGLNAKKSDAKARAYSSTIF